MLTEHVQGNDRHCGNELQKLTPYVGAIYYPHYRDNWAALQSFIVICLRPYSQQGEGRGLEPICYLLFPSGTQECMFLLC